MRKKTHSRWLATLLAVAMCLSMLPAGVLAAEEETKYVQVTDVSEITSGGEFVLVAEIAGETTEYKALGTTVNSKKKLDPITVTVADETVVGDLPIWTLASSGEGVSLFNGSNYLGYASSTNFAASNDVYTWNVAVSNGAFSFTASTAARGIAYGMDQNVFGPYATSNATSTKYVFNFLVFKAVSGGDTPDPTPIKVATPTCAPAGGSTAEPGSTVALFCATEGVNYRKGGSKDTLVNFEGSTFTLPEEDGEYTIFVQAMKAGLEDSDIAEFNVARQDF